MSISDWLFNPAGLTPHGFCLSWIPGLVELHAASDALTGLAYLSIPLALGSFVRQRPDVQYGWIIYLFVAFILACGTTHLMSILTLWVPVYGVEGLIKAVTAALSIATATILWPLLPKLKALPSPAQLTGLNNQLRATIAEQESTAVLLRESEARGRAANLELERRVAEQTAELRATNLQLSEALAHRTSALQERDILLREVYHRVKNNLQVVDGLIVAQARQITDADAKSAVLGLRQRIFALGLVHHQLMDSKDLRTFDIAPFLRELSNNIIESGASEGIAVSVQAIPLEVGLDFAIPLGLLVTELVTNSLKHAFPGGTGNISVIVERTDDGDVALIVADNGRGQPAEAAEGFKIGLGTRIISSLVEQLNGKLSISGDNGTRTEIRIPSPMAA